MNTPTLQLVTARGLVATTPQHIVNDDGLHIISFRFATPNTKFDPSAGAYVTDQTNWFTVYAIGRLAENAGESIQKGDRIVVHGTLKIRDWDNGERSGTSVEIDAITMGLDLQYGKSTFERTPIDFD